MGRV
jgi:translation initiation factor 5B